MKKMLITALAFTAMASAAFAQQTVPVKPQVVLPIDRTESVRAPKPGSEQFSVLDEIEYRWNFNILRRYGPGGDTNRSDMTVPLDFGDGVEMRGFGQIYSPRTFYTYYNGSVYNAETNIIPPTDQNFESDQDYIDQFKNAGAYTITGIGMPLFRNPRNTPANPGLITIYKTGFNFLSSAYRSQGFGSGRSALTVLREIEISQDQGLDTTITTNDRGDSVVNTTVLDFSGDPGSPNEPLSLRANESVIVLYTNEFAPAVVQPVTATDVREWQRVIATHEYREGDYVEDPNNPGQFLDQRANPLDSFKTFAVVMFRQNGADSIYSAWQALRVGDRRAYANLNMTFVGTVTLGSVEYHFGKDASSQGLGNVAPNPVQTETSVPFSLTSRANVRIDLFDSRGELVKNLVDNRYVEGNYSYKLSTDDLTNGVYLVRMIANDQVYTSKLTVSK